MYLGIILLNLLSLVCFDSVYVNTILLLVLFLVTYRIYSHYHRYRKFTYLISHAYTNHDNYWILYENSMYKGANKNKAKTPLIWFLWFNVLPQVDIAYVAYYEAALF